MIEFIMLGTIFLLGVGTIVSVVYGFRVLAEDGKIHAQLLQSVPDSMNVLRLATDKVREIVLKHAMLTPRSFIGTKEFGQASAILGLSNIEFLIRELKLSSNNKNFSLVGVNRGGNLLATYLAHRLEYHERNLLKFDYCPETDEINYEAPKDGPNGTLILVDDIARSGQTITKAFNHLAKENPQKEILCMVLVNCINTEEHSSDNSGVINYSSWLSYNNDVEFLWTKAGHQKNSSKNLSIDLNAWGINEADVDIALQDIK